MKQKRQIFILAFPCALVLMVLFVAPMIYVLVQTLITDGLTYFIKFLSDVFYLKILGSTIVVSVVTTLITFLLGYPTAYFLARTKSRVKNVLMIATIFPFLVSAVVRAYGWIVILGDNGLLNQFLTGFGFVQDPVHIMYTPVAVVIGLVQLLLPYMILSITSVIQSIDKNVEDAAASLGAGPVKTFFKVVLPLSSPGIIAGCILVFTLSMTSYVTPKLLGGVMFRTVSTMVYQEVQVNFNWPLASAISYILLAFILIFQLVANVSTKGINRRMGGGAAIG